MAENRLLDADIAGHVNLHMRVSQRMLTYGDGSIGSDVLRLAVAKFVNDRFRPVERLGYTAVTVLNAVSAILDCLAWCIRDEGVCCRFRSGILVLNGILRLHATFGKHKSLLLFRIGFSIR